MRYLQLAVLSLLLLTVFSSRSSAVSIENEHLSLGFNDKGSLISIYNKVSNKEYYHGEGRIPIRVLYLADKKLSPVQLNFVSSELKSITNGKILTLVYSGEGVTANVEVKVLDNNPKSTWNLTIENNGDREIVEVIYPDFDNIHIGDNPSDDTLVRPNRYGEKIPNPAANLFHKEGDSVNGLKYQEWWNKTMLVYSGEAGMFWMDIYDKTGGLYLASEDKTLIGGYLLNEETGKVGMGLGKYLHVKKGQKFTLQYAVGIHTGDWHWGADRYREWANTFMRRAEIPRWVREMPCWYWRAMIWSMTQERPKLHADFKADDFDGRMLDGALALKSDVFGFCGMELMGHDYPLWWPDPNIGNEDEIRAENARVKRRGGHIVPYINTIYSWENYPNIPHSENPEFQERLKQIPADVKQINWDYYKDFYAKKYDDSYNIVEFSYYGRYPQMCMATKEWQDYTLWWTHKYASDYGFSGVQWDQLGAYPSQYCTNWSHGHQHSGTGAIGTQELCRRIYEDPEYKVDKDFYIWYEGASDFISQYLMNCHAGFDMWMAWSFPEMIRYTFQHNFYSGEYFDQKEVSGQPAINIRRSAELSFLSRYKLGVGQEAPHAFKVSKLMQITNALKGIYWYTDYKDNLGCTAPNGMWTNVLQIDPKTCPYVGKDGFIIPYVDLRNDRKPCQIRLSKKLYDLSGVKKVYWYPNHLQGLSKEIKFDNTNPDYIKINLPELGALNIFNYKEAYCAVDDTISNIGAIVIAKQELHPIKILAPIEARSGEEVTFRTVEQKIVGNGASVSISFNTGIKAGLSKVDYADGNPIFAEKAGQKCLQTSPESPFIYFDITDKSFTDTDAIVEVKVRYFDEGKDTLRIQYNSSDMYAMPNEFGQIYQDYKASPILYKQDTKTWKTATFLLPDALFTGKMNGHADFRIDSFEDGIDYISAVTVTKKQVKNIPVPGVTLCVGNDQRITDANGMLKYSFNPNDPKGTYILDAYKDGEDGYLPVSSVIKLQ